MSTVYQHQLHGHKHHHRRKWKRWLLVPLVISGIAVWAGLNVLDTETTITNAAPTTKTVTGGAQPKAFRQGGFSMSLPVGWQYMGVQKDVNTIYRFRSASPGKDGNRLLDVYQDSALTNFAVNRMISVEATEDGGLITDTSRVSDNCTAYTAGETTARSRVGQTAKWQGITFLCDMANPQRNVVGTGSSDGLNRVYLSDLSTGRHSYFLTYTDNNDKPDFNIFVTAINSFKLDQ